jgi:hypothetical protein
VKSPVRSIVQAFVRHYYRALVAAPEARVWYHNLYQQLEDTGEVPNLSTCVGRLGDETIEPLFDRHQKDERRHAGLWKDLLQRRGQFTPQEIPGWGNTVAAFCDAGWTSVANKLAAGQPIHQSELIPMFAGVNALEMLAIERFQLMSDLHREIDPEISALLDTIIKDEKFHAAYTEMAVLRFGKNNGCLEWAQECLTVARASYRSYALVLMPRYADILVGKGARFSYAFLAFTKLVKLYALWRPGLPVPPRPPATLLAERASISPALVAAAS